MTTDKTTIPSVLTVKRIVKELCDTFRKSNKRDKNNYSGVAKEFHLVVNRYILELRLLGLIELLTCYPRFIIKANSRRCSTAANYISVTIDNALRTGNYEDIQKCLIIVKSIIVNSNTQRGAMKQAKMVTDAINEVTGWYRDYICTIKDGKLTSKTHARFNGNWKKPMVIIELQGIRQVVITEHTIDVTKYVGRMDKSKLITDLV